MKHLALIVALLGSLLVPVLCAFTSDGADGADPDSPNSSGATTVTLGPTSFARGPLFIYSGRSGVFLDGNGELVVALKGSASAGDEWTYSVEPEGMLQQTTSAYSSDTLAVRGKKGGLGFYYWVFEGVQEGDALLTFTYTDPKASGRDVDPEAYWVSVGADGKIDFFKRLVPRTVRPSRPMGGMVR